MTTHVQFISAFCLSFPYISFILHEAFCWRSPHIQVCTPPAQQPQKRVFILRGSNECSGITLIQSDLDHMLISKSISGQECGTHMCLQTRKWVKPHLESQAGSGERTVPQKKNGVVPPKRWEKGERKRQQVSTIPPYLILGNSMFGHARDRKRREKQRGTVSTQ